ncbi:MAG: 50S ribosome-binding GTPase [Candidatus Wallbacteria bacterium]|nr:50S ribosome-binding GTPase [Candidatus Wallbacteria bacterium]
MKATEELMRCAMATDAFLYFLDARAPVTTFNQDFIPGDGKLIILLNKADLAPYDAVALWQKRFRDRFPVFSLSARDKSQCLDTMKKIRKIITRRVLYLMVAGVPNVGKSLFIRNVTGKKIKVGSSPGVTTKVSWLPALDGVHFADTPGILWPRIDGDDMFARLCLIDAIGGRMIDSELAGRWLLRFLEKHAESFARRYGAAISSDPLVNIRNISDRMNIRKEESSRAWEVLIQDFRCGRLGKLVLDEIE